MNCTLIQEYLSQWTDGELHPAGEAELFAHLSTCETCRAFLKDLFTLKQVFASERPLQVPASLDQRIRAVNPAAAMQKRYIPWLRSGQTYTFRVLGLAVIFSIITTFVVSTFFYRHIQTQLTIVCLTPLPEVEVNGYVVVAPSPTKGINQ